MVRLPRLGEGRLLVQAVLSDRVAGASVEVDEIGLPFVFDCGWERVQLETIRLI